MRAHALQLLFTIVLLSYQHTWGSATCESYYGSQPALSRAKILSSISNRLKDYFGRSWNSEKILAESQIARSLLKDIARSGTDTDLKIFDLYLKILESTSGRYHVRTIGFYIDMQLGLRPKSTFFQERHWDWSIFHDYFFNDPLPFSVVKEQDIEYLTHVLETAKRFKEKTNLRNVLRYANHTWSAKGLSKDPKIARAYRKFAEGKMYDEVLEEIQIKLKTWANQGSDNAEKSARKEKIKSALDSFRKSNSVFDLFIFDSYFNLLAFFDAKPIKMRPSNKPNRLQLTDWKVFERGLPDGSLSYVVDFLFQSSHDIDSKLHLLKILQHMNKTKDSRYAEYDLFYSQFTAAHKWVQDQSPKHPPPPMFKTSLDVYAKSFSPEDKSAQLDLETLTRTQVSWNETLGRPQVDVLESYPVRLNRETTVGQYESLRVLVEAYFNHHRRNETYKSSEIDHDEKQELNALLKNVIYFAEKMPSTDDIVSLVRLFDATNVDSFIEKEFPTVKLPRNNPDEKVFEIGRLLGSNIIDGPSFEFILPRISEYLKITNVKGSIYLDANQVGMRYYRRYGFEVTHTPEQLGWKKESDSTPLWVMKMTIEQFIKTFSKDSYSSVPLKTGN